MSTAVDCRELFKVHRTTEGDAAALQGLSLQVQAGEVLTVLGPSGAGKSTLLRVVAGLERPSSGSAHVLGHDLARLSARRRAQLRRELIGFVGQDPAGALPPDLTIAAAVELPLALRGQPAGPRRRRAAGLLERVGLGDLTAALPAQLSGGERQRAVVAAGLAHGPRLVLADEPTGALDAATAQGVLDLLVAAAAEEQATVLLVSHDLAATRVADRVVRIRDGRVSDESIGGEQAVVVGRGGWLRIPQALLAGAGIADRARVRLESGAVVVEAPGGLRPAPESSPALDGAQRSRVEGPAVHVIGVDKGFDAGHARRDVFTGLSATLEPGVFTVVTGRSGSGKSTLLRLVAGLERPDAGTVLVGDEQLACLDREGLAALRTRAIAVVDQDPALAGLLTAEELVAAPLQVAGTPDGEAREAAGIWLARVGLALRAGQRAGRLSAGERQRVAIARALAAGRGLLLVDEPTARLDERSARETGLLLAAAAREHGATVIAATHDPLLAEAAGAELALGDLARVRA